MRHQHPCRHFSPQIAMQLLISERQSANYIQINFLGNFSHFDPLLLKMSDRKNFKATKPSKKCESITKHHSSSNFGSFACNFVYLVAFELIIDAFIRF